MLNAHPYFVHFPIAILTIGVLWDVLGVTLKKDSLLRAGWWALLFGVLAIVAAVVAGLIAANTVPHSEAAHEMMETHETLGLVAAGIFAVLLVWRAFLRTNLPSKLLPLLLYFVLAIGATAVMFTGAHLGGRMVYEYGVGGSAVQQPEGAGHHHGDEKQHDTHGHDATIHENENH